MADVCKDYNYNLVVSHSAHAMFLTDYRRTSSNVAILTLKTPQTKYEATTSSTSTHSTGSTKDVPILRD